MAKKNSHLPEPETIIPGILPGEFQFMSSDSKPRASIIPKGSAAFLQASGADEDSRGLCTTLETRNDKVHLLKDMNVLNSKNDNEISNLNGCPDDHEKVLPGEEEMDQDADEIMNSKDRRLRLSPQEKDIPDSQMNGHVQNKEIADIKTRLKAVEELVGISKKRKYSEFSESESDESAQSLKILEGRVKKLASLNRYLKSQNERLHDRLIRTEERCSKLELKNSRLQEVNVKLQRKIVNSSPFNASYTENTDAHGTFSTSLGEKNVPLPDHANTSAPICVLKEEPASFDEDGVSMPFAEENGDTVYPMYNSFSPMEDRNHSATSYGNGLENSLLSIDTQKLTMALARVKPGPAGDSLYIKNLSVVIFGEEVLMSSSVTGVKCNAKKDAIAKPPLCPVKMKLIKDLFVKRVYEEGRHVSDQEVMARCQKIRPAIAEKIATLVRCIK